MSFFTTDRIGFPMVTLDSLPVDVHLLPMTKRHFELFLAEPNVLDDDWYLNVLSLNPRARRAEEAGSERHFITGILPGEAISFARWLGNEYRLPTVHEWQEILHRFGHLRGLPDRFLRSLHESPARSFGLERLLANRPGPLTHVSRMLGGVMEWSRGTRGWRLMGQPRPRFARQLYSSQLPVTPIDPDKRHQLNGFRLVRDRRPHVP